MDCHPSVGIARSRRRIRRADACRVSRWCSAVLSHRRTRLARVAGSRIDSTAQMTFDVAGVAQAPRHEQHDDRRRRRSARCGRDRPGRRAGAVAGGAIPAPWLSFSVTNTGNGSEPLRLGVDAAITGDDFDPTSPSIYLESNGTPGLQTRRRRRHALRRAALTIPCWCATRACPFTSLRTFPSDLPQGALGRVSLRAVPRTVFVATGTDDPTNAGVSVPGHVVPGAGDPAPAAATSPRSSARRSRRLRCVCLREGGTASTPAVVTLDQDGHVGDRSAGRQRGSCPARSSTTASTWRWPAAARRRISSCAIRCRRISRTSRGESRRFPVFPAASRPTTTLHRAVRTTRVSTVPTIPSW